MGGEIKGLLELNGYRPVAALSLTRLILFGSRTVVANANRRRGVYQANSDLKVCW